MANEFKVKKGLIVEGSGGTILDIQGSVGQLFSITDSLTGDLFAVSDISGIPILNVNSSGAVDIDGTLNLGDSDKIQLGASQDLQIYHNGTHNYIDGITNDLYIRTVSPGDDVVVQAYDDLFLYTNNGADALIARGGAAVEVYHNNVKKLETTSTGVTVTGGWVTDGVSVATANVEHTDNTKSLFGNGNDLQVFHNGSNSHIETSSTSTGDFFVTARGTNHDLYLEAADNIYIRPQGNENGIVVVGNGGVTLYHNNVAKLETTSTGVTVTGNIAATNFSGSSSGTNTGDQTLPTLSSLGALSTSAAASTYLPLAGGTMTGSLTIGDGSAATRLIIKRVDSTVADDIQFYNGTTRVGEIGTTDTTWLRINQNTSKNIYTPRYIRADNGFFVDGTAKGINGSGNFIGGTITGASDANVSNWDTAYGWGDHSAAGYGDATEDYVGEQIGAISIPSGNAIIDWTADQGSTNIHSGNYSNTQLSQEEVLGMLTAGANITIATDGEISATDTVYTHPTSAGNKHIPTGGAAGQFLRYSSSGTATWATPSYTTNTNTTYSAGTGLDLTSTTFSVEPDLRDGITHVGKDTNNYIQFDSTNGRIDFYAGGVFVARMESDGDLHMKGDVIAFSDIF